MYTMNSIDMIIAAAQCVADDAEIDANNSDDHAATRAAYAVKSAFDGFIMQLEYMRLEAAKEIVEEASKTR